MIVYEIKEKRESKVFFMSRYIFFPAALRSSAQSLHFYLDFANNASSHGVVFVMHGLPG